MSLDDIKRRMLKQEQGASHNQETTTDAILMLLSALKEISDDTATRYQLIIEGIMALDPPQNVVDTFIGDIQRMIADLNRISRLADSTAKEILR